MLCNEAIFFKIEIDPLTNATVVDDAIKFVSQKSKENLKSTDSSNEDEDQLKEEHEEKTGEIASATIELD